MIFATYQIPCAVLQNGGRIDEIPAQVQARIKDLLVANAKLWTPANILIYNVPLQRAHSKASICSGAHTCPQLPPR